MGYEYGHGTNVSRSETLDRKKSKQSINQFE